MGTTVHRGSSGAIRRRSENEGVCSRRGKPIAVSDPATVDRGSRYETAGLVAGFFVLSAAAAAYESPTTPPLPERLIRAFGTVRT
ncbi:hypothetical protein BRD12_04530 [Halobacteriales archaeon SW_12_67_38]|nr:MAG: hypothetical protein BRD12_04530 [Halobacteriales archaeon SW_12_67_38]